MNHQKNVGTRESLNASSAEDLGIQKDCRTKMDQENVVRRLKKLSSELIDKKCTKKNF